MSAQPRKAGSVARIARLTLCVGAGSARQIEEIAAPGWEEIEAAIRALDAQGRSALYLWPREAPAGTYLLIGGGAGRFLVTGAMNDEVFPTLIDPARSAAPHQVLNVGGLEGQYENNQVHDEATVLRVARSFHDAGDFAPELHWRLF
jgi:hypothetical protein